MVFNVNKQWVLHNCDRKSMLNKYDHLRTRISSPLVADHSAGQMSQNGPAARFERWKAKLSTVSSFAAKFLIDK